MADAPNRAPAELERRDVQTPLGVVPVRGRLSSFDAKRPLIFAISGVFASPGALDLLPDQIAGCDVAIVRLPGMRSTHLSRISVEDFAAAFDEVIRSQFAGRTVLRLGLSIGGVVAIAMREGGAFVAVDPPL